MRYIYSKENEYKEAIDYGEKAVYLENTTPSYHQHLGDVYLEASSPKNEIYIKDEFHENINMDFVLKSIQCYEKAIELNISQNNEHLNSSIYPNLANAYLVNDDFKKSIEFNEKAIECGNELDIIYINLGMAYVSLGEYKKCIEYYEPLVDKEIDSFVVKANLAVAYIVENSLDKAEFLLNTLISESPEYLHLHIHLAEVKYEKGEFQEGIEVLNNADVPTFIYPDSASKTFANMWKQNYALQALYETPEIREDLADIPNRLEKTEAIIQKALKEGRDLLTEEESKQVMKWTG